MRSASECRVPAILNRSVYRSRLVTGASPVGSWTGAWGSAECATLSTAFRAMDPAMESNNAATPRVN